MSELDLSAPVSRRRALAIGGGLATGSVLAGGTSLTGAAMAAKRHGHLLTKKGNVPVKEIERIVAAQGSVTDGVLGIGISRDDIGDVRGPLGVKFTGGFQIDGMLTFQPLGRNLAFLNGDLPLRPAETQRFIDALLGNGLIFQAFHQHFIETNPSVWFMHFRGLGHPLQLAQAVRNAMKATGIKLPQMMPKKPKTPLDAKRLGAILHGQAQVGDKGVVTVTVARRGRIVIDRVLVSPDANISTNIEFNPLSHSESHAAAAPDFSLDSAEVQPVMSLMREQGWFVGCLYNQETNEKPQLYFSHMLKMGDAYTLAAEIRRGLDRTHAA